MQSFTTLLALLSLATTTLGAIPSASNQRFTSTKFKGDVRLQSEFDPLDETAGSGGDWTAIFDADDPRSLEQIFSELALEPGELRHVFNNTQFKGFSGSLSSHCVNIMTDAVGVKMFEPEVEIQIADVQTNAPWGLNRISQGPALVDPPTDAADIEDIAFRYNFEGEYTTLGEGVDIYVVDTGINVDHVDFGGRASWGFTIDEEEDKDGHGTHCAGTAAGATFGVAKGASLIAVRVLGAEGGSSGDIIAGLQFVIDAHDQRKTEANFKGSVISMSLGAQGRSDIIDLAVTKASEAGIHISVAAGNDAVDTCTSSPAGVAAESDVISVSATDIFDNRAGFSNFGECSTVYAPGTNITSTFIGGVSTVNVLQGTSMACPHVTGLLAYQLGLDSALATDTAAMKKLMIDLSSDLKTDVGTVKFVNNGQTAVQTPVRAETPATGGRRRNRNNKREETGAKKLFRFLRN